MNITAPVSTNHGSTRAAVRPAQAAAVPTGFALNRLNSGGRFSVMAYGVVLIDADAGLLVRVHGGCLWVPNEEEQCSVGVGAGEQFVVRRAGPLATLATRATQVELVWPVPAVALTAA